MKIFIKDKTLTFKERLLSLFSQDKKKIILISGGGVILIVLLSLIFWQIQGVKKIPKKTTLEAKSLLQDLVPEKQLPPEIPTPEVSFEKYQLATSLPQLPPQITLYTFKTNYSDQEVRDFTTRFGLFEFKPSQGDYLVAFNLKDPESLGYLVFNKKTGCFSFQSYGGHKPLFFSTNNPVVIAESFLKEKGLLDETIIQHATYQRAGLPEITFVEFHRSWDKAEMPILNFVGLLNLDETVKLANLKLGMIDQRAAADSSIINTSDNYDGKARPNDFNTITVAVTDEGEIFSVESNLRPIAESQALTFQNTTFLTPQQAFEEIKKGNGIFKLTIPSGAGTTDLKKVYPANLASSKQATVTDYILAYLEKPPLIWQKFFQPVYIFKGQAQLTSGYRINWIQAVPAIANTEISLPEVLGERSIQLGTFSPPPTKTPASTSTPSTPITTPSSPSPIQSPSGDGGRQPLPGHCIPDEAHLSPIYNLAGLGRVGQWTIPLYEGIPGTYNPQWYFVPPKDQPLPDLDQVLEEFKSLGVSRLRLQRRAILEARWRGNWGPVDCPLLLTGPSPTLFVYAPKNTQVTIKSGASLTYSDPAYNSKTGWQITASPNGNLYNHYNHYPYLYYEYESIHFQKPRQGWVVEKSQLDNLTKEILSPALGLTSQEEERLLFEFNHASFGLSSPYIFVGTINPKEVEQKIPLEITPRTAHVIRLHFYLGPVQHMKSISAPKLVSIKREKIMVLELGATN